MEAAETTALFRRDDTFLGVCQALGEDFGFNPVFLRVAFAAPLIFAPMLVIEIYLGLGVVVLLSRILAPRPKRKVAPVLNGSGAASSTRALKPTRSAAAHSCSISRSVSSRVA